jgi:hypothetical protein
MSSSRARKLVRWIDSAHSVLYDALFGAQGDSGSGRIRPSVWSNTISIVLAAAILNCTSFLFVLGPQNLSQILGDSAPQLQRATMNLNLFDIFLSEEKDIAARQAKRVSALEGFSWAYSPGGLVINAQERCKTLSLLSTKSQLEVARDIGTIRSFETVGFDWTREWAKAQGRAGRAEMQSWQIAHEVAESCLKDGENSQQVRGAIKQFSRQRLDLVSAMMEVVAYNERMKPIGMSEVTQVRNQTLALQSHAQSVAEIMSLSASGLQVVLIGLVTLCLIWLSGRLEEVVKRRDAAYRKFTD